MRSHHLALALAAAAALAGCGGGGGDDGVETPAEFESWFGTSRIVGIALDDSQGGIYAAAGLSGLRYFNGTSWSCYLTENSAIPSNTVRDAALDSMGICWIATDRGVGLFNGFSFARMTKESTGGGLPSNDVLCLFRDASGLMWAGTAAGAARYSGSSWSVFSLSSGLASNTVTCIGQDRSAAANMWFGHDGEGLSMLDSLGAFVLHGASEGLADGRVNGMGFDSNNIGWFATDDGLYSFDGVSFASYKAGTTDLPHNLVRDVSVDPLDAVWCATAAGFARLGGGLWTAYAAPDIQSDDTLSCLAPTGLASWVGSAGGLDRLSSSGWVGSRLNSARLPSDVVNCACADSLGRLWIGTEAGLGRNDGGTWAEWKASAGTLSDGRCRAIAVDSDGTAWIGTPAGLDRFASGGWLSFSTSNSGIPSNAVNGIDTDSAGGLWLATGNGVSRFDRAAAFVNHGAAEGLTGLSVNCIGVDGLDRVWAGTTEGLFMWDGASWISYGTADGLPSAAIRSVAFGSSSVWVATPLGAAEFDGSAWTPHTAASHALLSDDARSVAVADSGDVHIATAAGLASRIGTSWVHRNVGNSGLLLDDLRLASAPAGFREVYLGTNGSGVQVYRPAHLFPGN